MEIERVRISDLTIDAENAKLHPDFQVEQIKESIKAFGFNDPIGIWGKDNLIVEGHGRVYAMKELGAEEIDCIRLDHLSEDERRAYALAHNSTNMTSGFDDEILTRLLDDLDGKFDMRSFGLEMPERGGELDEAEEDDYDEVAEPAAARTKLGEVYALGKHVLVVGDATKEESYRLFPDYGEGAYDLLATDPPYNVDYTKGSAGVIENDAMDRESFTAFLTDAFGEARKPLKAGGVYYCFFAIKSVEEFMAAARKADLPVHQILMWVKQTFTFGRDDYKWQYEPILYGWKEGAAHYFRDVHNESTVIESDAMPDPKKMKKDELVAFCEKLLAEREEIPTDVIREDRPTRSELHPTMKPIRLMARLIANSSKRGEIVLDPFGGSGSTLMACEQLGRKCRTMELDPKYADAIIDRWEKYTGAKVERLREADE